MDPATKNTATNQSPFRRELTPIVKDRRATTEIRKELIIAFFNSSPSLYLISCTFKIAIAACNKNITKQVIN